MADRLSQWLPTDEVYSDSDRLDEMNTAEDYNRFEEEQVFQDREGMEEYLEGEQEPYDGPEFEPGEEPWL